MPVAPFAEMRKIFMEDIGETVGQFFVSFDEEPIGSASIAQVYKAVLRTRLDSAKRAAKSGGEDPPSRR